MAIFQALFAFVLRSLSRLLNTAFGWATMMLFGKVPANRQIFLSVIALGSVIWLFAVLGIFFPRVATFALTFVTLPSWVNDNLVRLAMFGAAVVVPLGVGAISAFALHPNEPAASTGSRVKTILRGYPATFGIAVTLVILTIFTPINKLIAILRRWETQHVPVIVEPADYAGFIDEMEQALEMNGQPVERRPASIFLRIPTRLVTALAGGTLTNLVSEQLTTLRSRDLEIMLHPSDLVISGKPLEVVHARATIAEQLAFSKAYMTWDPEANVIESRLKTVWKELKERPPYVEPEDAAESLRAIEQDLCTFEIPYDEWEVLFREKLLVERALLQMMASVADRPLEPATARAELRGAQAIQTAQAGQKKQSLIRIAAFAGMAVLAFLGLRKSKAPDQAAGVADPQGPSGSPVPFIKQRSPSRFMQEGDRHHRAA
jgi:hypothetical protein